MWILHRIDTKPSRSGMHKSISTHCNTGSLTRCHGKENSDENTNNAYNTALKVLLSKLLIYKEQIFTKDILIGHVIFEISYQS